MKFKIDENLPSEVAAILQGAGFEADTVADEDLSGAADALLACHYPNPVDGNAVMEAHPSATPSATPALTCWVVERMTED